MQISTDNNTGDIFLSQPGFVDKILKSTGLDTLKISKTPIATYESVQDDDDQVYDSQKYLMLVGLLNYLAVFTRPDILYAMSI